MDSLFLVGNGLMALYACRKTIPIFLDDIHALHYSWCNEDGRGNPVPGQYLVSLDCTDKSNKGGMKPTILEEA